MKLIKPLCIFDLETTGVDIIQDRIVQLAWKHIKIDGTTQQASYLINPTIPILPEATAVHGITDEMVAGKRTFKELCEEGLLTVFTGCDLAGYNIKKFDMPILIEEILRSGATGLPFDEDILIYDAMQVFFSDAPRNLEAAFQHYTGQDVDTDKLHEAGYDTTLTADIISMQLKELGLKERLAKLPEPDVKPYRFSQKFYIKDGDIYFNFGKHKDKRAKDEVDYLQWMCSANFSNNDQNIAYEILGNTGQIKMEY